MCRRFLAVRVDVIGSAHDVGSDAARRSSGLVPGATRPGTTSSVRQRQMATVAVGLAELALGGRIEKPDVSVLTLAVEAL